MADNPVKRTKPSEKRRSLHDVNDYSYNEQAGAFKVLGPIIGRLSKLGPINVATSAGYGSLVAIYNDSTSTAWAKTGTSAVSGPAAGDIALPPQSYTIISLGPDTHVIASTITCYGYIIEDDAIYTP